MASNEATTYDGARQEFLALYPNRAQHIYKVPSDKNWKVSRFRFATGLVDAAISCESDNFYGAFWGSETAFAVIDIDKNSQYHNVQALQTLCKKLSAIGLSGQCLYQSSNSKGWHLYLPFAEKAPSKELERTLKAWLKLEGYEITCGQLEVFPSGNALRLPLQRGFAWLDDNGEIIVRREQLTLEAALGQFLSDFQRNRNKWIEAKDRINSQLDAAAASAGDAGELVAGRHEKAIDTEGFDGLFNYKLIAANYERGRRFWQEGLTEKNQRHKAIICVEHYLWHGDPVAGLPAYPGRFNDKARFRLIRAWLEQKHNGYSWHVAAGNWQAIEADINRACVWRGETGAQVHEPYPCTERAQDVLIAKSRQTGRVWTMDDLKKGNDRRERSARSKIRRAIRKMLAVGQQLTRNSIAEKSGCSPNTVSKHRDLWNLLTSGSGDQSRGVEGGSGSSVALFLVESEKPVINSSQSELSFSDSGNAFAENLADEETPKSQEEPDVFPLGNTSFILPYGSQRRPSFGSDSRTVRQLCFAEVLAAVGSGGIKESRGHNSIDAVENDACRTAQAVYGTDLRPTPLISRTSKKQVAGSPALTAESAAVYRFVIDAGG